LEKRSYVLKEDMLLCCGVLISGREKKGRLGW
jgi:hypothetical protein